MTQTTSATALESALAYHRAWTSVDVDGAVEYLADDIVYHAPGFDLTGKDVVKGFLGGFAPTLTGLTDLAAFGDDDHVVLFYYPHIGEISSAPAAEHFTFRDGKIAEIVVVFDRLSFAPQQ